MKTLQTGSLVTLGIAFCLAIGGCGSSNDADESQQIATSIDEAMDADTTLLYDDVIHGVGFTGAIEVRYDFKGKVLETVGSTALVVPVDEPWYDTVSVDLTPYGPYPDREIPESMWRAMDPDAMIPVVAYRVERYWEESGPTKGVTDWDYEINWWSYYGPLYNKGEPAAVADQFYGN